MHKNPARRFIAGAVCPQCGKVDKIAVEVATDRRLCVSCGFSEGRPEAPDAAGPGPGELPTRVSRAAARRVETPAEAVTLIDPAAQDNERGD
ncbi:MAG: YheV family putative metal-binding protein [Halioglobus sp.]|nr:YheV family putative metal-binding protein [Halioglobus sp.]